MNNSHSYGLKQKVGRIMKRYPPAWIIAIFLLFGGALLAERMAPITPFSDIDPASGIPEPWKPLTFPKIPTHTEYRPKSMDGRIIIEARSRGGASGLAHELDVNPQKSPWLRWQWRVDHALESADVTSKDGDDCAARIYVAFKFDGNNKNWWERFKYKTKRTFAGQEIPGSAIVYAWANGVEIGKIINSPYTKESKLIVVQSGDDLKRQWVDEQRNVVDDYIAAYGVSPPAIVGIAIMTDTDNTGSETTAYYGDIRLESE